MPSNTAAAAASGVAVVVLLIFTNMKVSKKARSLPNSQEDTHLLPGWTFLLCGGIIVILSHILLPSNVPAGHHM